MVFVVWDFLRFFSGGLCCYARLKGGCAFIPFAVAPARNEKEIVAEDTYKAGATYNFLFSAVTRAGGDLRCKSWRRRRKTNMAGAEENGDDLPIDLGSYKYKTLKDVPLGGLRDALELVATGAPTSLSLDTLVTCPDDLAIVIKTLDEQGTKQGKGAIEHHTVTAISMRYCSVFRQTGPQQEECVRLLCELINRTWENEPEPGTVSGEPIGVMVEIFYLAQSMEDPASRTKVLEAWNTNGHLHTGPAEDGLPFTLKRKDKSYNPTIDQRNTNGLIPQWALEEEAANKPKPKKDKGSKKKK